MKKELLHSKLSTWFEDYPGKYILDNEQNFLNKILPRLPGYYLVQVGTIENYDYKSAWISNRVFAGKSAKFSQPLAVETTYRELPFQSESVDVFFLPHTLEFSSKPRHLLKEIYNILIPGGKVIVFGFNASSFWGLLKHFTFSNDLPWRCKFRSLNQVRRWVNSAGFSIEELKTFCYRPPFRNKNVLDKLAFFDTIGQKLLPLWGTVYVLVLEKKIAPLTPSNVKVFSQKIPISTGYEPSL